MTPETLPHAPPLHPNVRRFDANGQFVFFIAPQPAPTVLPAYEPPTEEQFEIVAATNGLYNLIEKYGAQRVMGWIRMLAPIAGQEVR